MSNLIIPKTYKSLVSVEQTELAIKQIKDFFQANLSTALRLRRVTAPLFVLKGLGINDDLNGVERAVNFPVKDLGDSMDMVKQEYGVRIHGVLGAKFLDKYSYVLDFANLIAYTRKKNSSWKKLLLR